MATGLIIRPRQPLLLEAEKLSGTYPYIKSGGPHSTLFFGLNGAKEMDEVEKAVAPVSLEDEVGLSNRVQAQRLQLNRALLKVMTSFTTASKQWGVCMSIPARALSITVMCLD